MSRIQFCTNSIFLVMRLTISEPCLASPHADADTAIITYQSHDENTQKANKALSMVFYHLLTLVFLKRLYAYKGSLHTDDRCENIHSNTDSVRVRSHLRCVCVAVMIWHPKTRRNARTHLRLVSVGLLALRKPQS